jgi:1,4-alpha-glucan branching enzyme
MSLLTDQDLYLFNEGSHTRLYGKLGAHLQTEDGVPGTHFAVWAPSARQVFVMGDFNGWNKQRHPLRARGQSGIWETFIPGVGHGAHYKYHIVSRYQGYRVDKADPFGFFHEVPPQTASIVWNLDYRWHDQDWMAGRKDRHSLAAPISIYEVHLGSWRRVPEERYRSLYYRELAEPLARYVRERGFTHVEFMPLTEHPFFGSWGYQTTGYFAPTSRYGSPQDLMFLIDYLHQQGIGVILDWVPSHFPNDEHGLGFFDGTHLFEHADPQKGFHPDWNSFIFNYGRLEVRSFLLSSALFWLDYFHADGLRVDAVASMLYLDYSRQPGQWVPNQYGGNENLEAISFLRRFNQEVYQNYPDVQTIAEESTAWPMVSRPTYLGGLGFGLKWDMGWMHDTLQFLSRNPIHRRFHHGQITFRMLYAFTENYVLPLSHDEVVHGKGSLLAKMPGDDWQQFANLRLLFGYMFGMPGKKLLFMGGELGQRNQWNHDGSLDWHLLQYAPHGGIQKWVTDLNRVHRDEPALHEQDCRPEGFEWIDCNDAESSTLSFLRKGHSVFPVNPVAPVAKNVTTESTGNTGKGKEDLILVICNFTPVPRFQYQVGVPRAGHWRELLNSDAQDYGGSGLGNLGGVEAEATSTHGRPFSLTITLPPLAIVFFKSS